VKYYLKLSEEARQEETDAYKISEYPFSYGYIENSKILRDMKVNRFPYLAIFIVSGNNITIVSLRNTHRRPYL
jgi:hypothetical protein